MSAMSAGADKNSIPWYTHNRVGQQVVREQVRRGATRAALMLLSVGNKW
jgi:hypothetical protein